MSVMFPAESMVISTTTSPLLPARSSGSITGSKETVGKAGRISNPVLRPSDSDPKGEPTEVAWASSAFVSLPAATFDGGDGR